VTSPAPRRLGNAEIAGRLERLAELLEIQGANPFRVRAYRAAAETVAGHERALADMVAADADLTALKGVGKDLAQAIRDLVSSGEIPQLSELEREVPVGLLDVVRLPGVGPARARTLWQQLGATSVDDVERLAREGRVATLSGFGEKMQAKLLRGVETARAHHGRFRVDEAERYAASLLEALGAVTGLVRLEVAGSYRRGRETVGDLDLLAVADDPAALMSALREHDAVREVLGSGDTKTSVMLAGGMQVDLRVVPAAAFGAALLYFTGSKSHNVELRQRAQDRGWRLSEYGLFEVDSAGETGARVAGDSEDDVYAALGLAFVPPELREGRGEIDAAAEERLPRLLTRGDLQGDLHLHTTWSDGRADIAAMVAACEARGHAYMAITDHSQALRMTGGLDAEKLARQWEALDAFEASHEGLTILRGLEVDILKDGSLDLSDEWLQRLDIVIVSVHSHFDLDQDVQTVRVLRALEHPQVNVLAHPTGRLLGHREPYAIDLDAVFEVAAARGVALELNASPQRLDLGDVHLVRAAEAGVTVVINTDAHTVQGLDDLRFGVATARRAWLGPDVVLNTWPLEQVRRFLAKER
jgi:DNA polymerase (family X)